MRQPNKPLSVFPAFFLRHRTQLHRRDKIWAKVPRRFGHQVTLDDAAAADELFSILMGEDVDARRSFITRNAKDVRFLDV
jgi:DNA gyrase/topoisomerase IV subunit B